MLAGRPGRCRMRSCSEHNRLLVTGSAHKIAAFVNARSMQEVEEVLAFELHRISRPVLELMEQGIAHLLLYISSTKSRLVDHTN